MSYTMISDRARAAWRPRVGEPVYPCPDCGGPSVAHTISIKPGIALLCWSGMCEPQPWRDMPIDWRAFRGDEYRNGVGA